MSYTAAAEFVRRVRIFAQTQPEWAECILYQTLPDERWDMTLASLRVYGTRDEALTIQAAAGLDSCEDELTERTLLLPTLNQLAAIKALTGFSTDPWARTPAQAADPIAAR